MKGDINLNANLQSVMTECTISHNSDKETDIWLFAYKRYLKGKDLTLLTSLAATKNQTLLDRLQCVSLHLFQTFFFIL